MHLPLAEANGKINSQQNVDLEALPFKCENCQFLRDVACPRDTLYLWRGKLN